MLATFWDCYEDGKLFGEVPSTEECAVAISTSSITSSHHHRFLRLPCLGILPKSGEGGFQMPQYKEIGTNTVKCRDQ